MADQAAVAASVQRLRARAYAAGALRTNSEQTVEVQQPVGQTVYVIQPANPQIVYVPQYNPTVVYVPPSSGAVAGAALVSFGVGIAIGALIVSNQPWGWGGWGWNWGSRNVYYNHSVWVDGEILTAHLRSGIARDPYRTLVDRATAAIGVTVHRIIVLPITRHTGQ